MPRDAPVLREWQVMMSIDNSTEGIRECLRPEVPGLRLGQLGVADTRRGIGHALKTEIGGPGQDRGQYSDRFIVMLTRPEISEGIEKACLRVAQFLNRWYVPYFRYNRG